jgi:PII-like signaling protein
MVHHKLEGKAKMLLIHIDDNDMWEGEPLYQAIVKKLRMMDLAGATGYRGILGYGAKNRVHRSGLLGFSNLPIIISVIDSEEKIRRALPVLEEMITEGLLAMADVEVIKYTSGKPDRDK